MADWRKALNQGWDKGAASRSWRLKLVRCEVRFSASCVISEAPSIFVRPAALNPRRSRWALCWRWSTRGGEFFFDPVVTALFEFERQILIAGLDDLAVHHHVNEIRLDVI